MGAVAVKSKAKKRLPKKVRTALTGYSFIAINVIGVFFFWVIPLIFSFVLSISKWDMSKGIAGIKITGFQNYIDMWKDEWFQGHLSIISFLRLHMWCSL